MEEVEATADAEVDIEDLAGGEDALGWATLAVHSYVILPMLVSFPHNNTIVVKRKRRGTVQSPAKMHVWSPHGKSPIRSSMAKI